MQLHVHQYGARRKSRGGAGKKKHFSRPRKRLRELERIIKGRHGQVQDTDDANLYLEPVANCFRMMAAERGRTASIDDFKAPFEFWCQEWATAISNQYIADIVRNEFAGPLKLIPDDVLGRSLRLSYAERCQTRTTTIGSFDVDRATRAKLRKARKNENDRLKKAEKRRAAGAKPRALYEATSLSRTEPWKAEGICRRTWERRQKKAAVASVSPHQTEVVASTSAHLLLTDERHTCDRVMLAPVPARIALVTRGRMWPSALLNMAHVSGYLRRLALRPARASHLRRFNRKSRLARARG